MVQGRWYTRLKWTKLRAMAAQALRRGLTVQAAELLVAEQGIPWHDVLAFAALARQQQRTQRRRTGEKGCQGDKVRG